MIEVKIPYKPRNWATALHDAATRWVIMVLHRRAGKTTAVLNHLQRDCLLNRERGTYAYIAPTYKQARLIAWDIAKQISAGIPGIEYIETDPRTIKYPNGAKLILLGADNPDSLRGMALWGVGLDEFPQQSSNIFSEVVSKCLADHLGYAVFFGTPKGKGEFYRMFESAKKNKDWTVIFRTIDDSLRDESGKTIENLRVALEDDRRLVAQGLMTEDEFNQEWYCSFEASIKGAYYSRELAEARKDGRIKLVPYDPGLMVHTVWDLGKGPKMSVGFFQRIGHEPRLVDYLEGVGDEAMPEMIKKVLAKPYIFGKHFAPHDIRAVELATGKTRISTAADLGMDFEVVPSISVDDGIDKAKLFLKRLWINDQKCQPFLDAVSQYHQEWDDDRKMFKETPAHDWTSHAADMLRYGAIVEDQMINDKRRKKQTDDYNPQWIGSEFEGSSRKSLSLDEAMGEK